MRVPKFVMHVRKNVKNMLSMEWNIANDALKLAGNVRMNVALWRE
jgi:hypothetical protein